MQRYGPEGILQRLGLGCGWPGMAFTGARDVRRMALTQRNRTVPTFRDILKGVQPRGYVVSFGVIPPLCLELISKSRAKGTRENKCRAVGSDKNKMTLMQEGRAIP